MLTPQQISLLEEGIIAATTTVIQAAREFDHEVVCSTPIGGLGALRQFGSRRPKCGPTCLSGPISPGSI
jgi:hypothetical protein